MNKYRPLPLLASLLLTVFFLQCKKDAPPLPSLQSLVAGTESIAGRTAYLQSPFLAAGDRVYMVGHQDGSFPDLGWHVAGEMGGIWDHPIKLMDGFTAAIETGGQTYCLSAADTFINFPFANKHVFEKTIPGLRVERFQFAPDGKEAVVVEFTFINQAAEEKELTFEFTGYTDLRPVWLGERTGMEDGGDFATWDEPSDSYIVKDSLNDWYVQFGAVISPEMEKAKKGSCEYSPAGKGCQASMKYAVKVPANTSVSLPFTIAGSHKSAIEVKQTFADVQHNSAGLLQAKKERYQTIAEKTKLTIPEKQVQEAFHWIKYNTDWLIRDVPEIGRGLAAGSPDYPWWFGVDNEYTLQGALAIGQTELVYSTIDLLACISEKTNGNGRIVHEVSTNGAVYNPGNVNETPQFASLIWTVYNWTGDKAFLEKYWPTVKKGLAWLMQENDKDGNLLPDGFGMMEIHGLNSEMIDVAVYTQKAFADAAQMAGAMGDDALSKQYSQTAELLRQKINKEFWVPEFNSYADFIGTAQQALHLIDDAIVRADTLGKPWAVAELKATKAAISTYPPQQKQGFVVHHNWVVNTPMEIGIADTAKALLALETGARFVNPFGMFVTGIDRDESAGKDEGSFAQGKKVFSYTGAVMTLPTGVQAIAENNYGRPDKALGYLQRMARTFSFALPGSMYEVSPDFGMMAQAWNLYSFAVPVVMQFFGIKPKAQERTVYLFPQMPSDWGQASIENVKVGDNAISVFYQKTGNGVKLTVTQEREDWKLVVGFPKGKFREWKMNGKAGTPKSLKNQDMLDMAGSKIEMEFLD
ncbi:MAG: glycogen debranching protein [Lewinellaceae bacterium]|nr:glycogen debranching protein [Lewinellaceae bacterium]